MAELQHILVYDEVILYEVRGPPAVFIDTSNPCREMDDLSRLVFIEYRSCLFKVSTGSLANVFHVLRQWHIIRQVAVSAAKKYPILILIMIK